MTWAASMAQTMKLVRELNGLGLRGQAKALDMSPSTLHRIEAGKGCDVDTLLDIHRKTGVKLETLLGLNRAE